MDGWMDRRMDGQIDGWTDGWINRWMDGQTDGWTDRWMDKRLNRQTFTHLRRPKPPKCNQFFTVPSTAPP